MTSTPTNIHDNAVTFDVGGQIFRVSRTLLDSYPNTMLARAASDLWRQSNDNTTSCTSSNNTENPIFIDRDSTRFACILYFMRDNCVVDLPSIITKDSFLRELQYFGFDMTNINTDCITYNLPTIDAIMKVDKLHKEFNAKTIKKLQQSKDFTIIAYVCFCETVTNVSLICTIQDTGGRLEIPPSAKGRIHLQSSVISDSSLIELNQSLYNLCEQFSIIQSTDTVAPTDANKNTNTNNDDSNIDNVTSSVASAIEIISEFDEHLAVYGLKCTSITKAPKINAQYAGQSVFTFKLNQTN
jgi:BTB/POZ domain